MAACWRRSARRSCTRAITRSWTRSAWRSSNSRFQERTAALHQEIAERQRLEREAQRAEHFALLGRLAAGVSHEIRNPLGAVFLHVDLFDEELHQPLARQPDRVAEALAEIKPSLARLEDLVQDYLSLVRVGTLERTPADVGPCVQVVGDRVVPACRCRWRDPAAGGR